MTVVRFQAGAVKRLFFLRHGVHTGSGAHPFSYPKGSRGRALSPGIKRPRREADHSPPSSAEFKNAWSYTSTHLYVFMAWYLVTVGDNFTVTFISLMLSTCPSNLTLE
jgi:hypothetical protein